MATRSPTLGSPPRPHRVPLPAPRRRGDAWGADLPVANAVSAAPERWRRLPVWTDTLPRASRHRLLAGHVPAVLTGKVRPAPPRSARDEHLTPRLRRDDATSQGPVDVGGGAAARHAATRLPGSCGIFTNSGGSRVGRRPRGRRGRQAAGGDGARADRGAGGRQREAVP